MNAGQGIHDQRHMAHEKNANNPIKEDMQSTLSKIPDLANDLLLRIREIAYGGGGGSGKN